MDDIRHILVATDLTDRSGRALQRALQLCRAVGARRLTLLHVVAAGLPSSLATQQHASAEAFLNDQLAQAGLVGTSMDAGVCTGDPFSTIIGEAITRAADLVVIGEPGKHRYAELFAGTTAERVIRFGDRPVLMVKQPPQGSYRRVLAAFDGSEGAVRALRTALTLAPGAEFRVVHAWWPPRVSLGEIEAARQPIDDENTRLKALIKEAARQATAPSASGAPTVAIDLVEDNPYVVISNQSSWADLLVLGTHSKGRLASTVSIGRLAQHLLVESSCDVLTSRP